MRRRGKAIVVLVVALVVVLGIAISPNPVRTASLVVGGALALFGAFVVGKSFLRRQGVAAVVLLAVTLLNAPLSHVVPGALEPLTTYADDFTLALFLALTPFLRGSGMSVIPRAAWIGFAAFGIAGVVGALITPVSTAGMLLGTWQALKLPLTIVVVMGLRWDARDIKILLRTVVGLVLANVAFMIAELAAPSLVQGVFGAPPSSSGRLGIPVLKGFFANPTQSSAFFVFAACVFLGAVHMGRRYLSLSVAVGAAVLSLRLKALIDGALIMAVLVAGRMRAAHTKWVRTLAPLGVAGLLGVVGLAGQGLISRQLSLLFSGDFARAKLYSVAADLANSYPPVGGGFGSFGSNASIRHYSWVYEEYGLSHVYGFRRGGPIFALDASWGTVLGESGYLGLAGMVVSCVAILVMLARRLWRDREVSWSLGALAFASVFVVDALSSTRLFSSYAATGLAILLALSAHAARARDPEAEARTVSEMESRRSEGE